MNMVRWVGDTRKSSCHLVSIPTSATIPVIIRHGGGNECRFHALRVDSVLGQRPGDRKSDN